MNIYESSEFSDKYLIDESKSLEHFTLACAYVEVTKCLWRFAIQHLLNEIFCENAKKYNILYASSKFSIVFEFQGDFSGKN